MKALEAVIDLHRHDDYSIFDGLGKPIELTSLAKELGYRALASSNHGTASGMIEHYFACKEAGIKPVLGVEVYFKPKFKEDGERYHLCLFCKNLQGYKNLNRMLSYANIHNFYYKPIITVELLEKYKEGLICTTACVASYFSQKLIAGKRGVAKKALKKFKDIFGDDFYVEIQPYKISEKGLQEKVNVGLMELAEELGIECILTSDSHYGRKEDFDTFVKMHQMRVKPEQFEEKENWVRDTYGERYMPAPNELRKRFLKMHSDVENVREKSIRYVENLEKIVNKVDGNLLDGLKLTLPKYKSGTNSEALLKIKIKRGLKKRGKLNKKYWKRCMEEYEVIEENGFVDYFLIVQDYVMWAKENGIAVGPGRGSVCNCEVAYALGITDVDSLYFGLDFSRFLRKDKKKLPDIDIDFETSRRGEVIEYLIKKYKGKAVQICSYGLYKVDNLLNDLFKVCGVTEPEDKKAIKRYVGQNVDDESGKFNYEELKYNNRCKEINSRYLNILKHFSKMYKKVRYIGTHAAGVAIVGTNIFDYTSVEKHGDKFSSAYDLNNLEMVNAIKFDMLGLRTLSVLKELKELTGEEFSDEWLEDEEIYKQFREGNTEAIFQFERNTAADILKNIKADCMEDICAANALNRPGPLGLDMPKQYAYNKAHVGEIKNSAYYEYTKETYGTIVYQEQITAICRNIGGLSWDDADKVLKMMKNRDQGERIQKEKEEEQNRIRDLFVKGAAKNGVSKSEARKIFSNLITYSFNKGHATGYSLIAVEMMYYKIHYPMYFWYVNLKYAPNDTDEFKYKKIAIENGTVILTPHVNSTARYSLRKVDGEVCIQEGLLTIKGVGEKAALAIEKERKENGKYIDIDNLEDRVPKRVLNARVINALKKAGACQFNRDKYFSYVLKYNTSIMSR